MSEIIHRVLMFLTELGGWGVFIGLAIEIIPSEIVLAYAGYLVYKGELNVPEAVIFGTLGIIVAQLILYAIGRYGGRPFVEKFGKYLHIKSKHIDITEKWFNRYGVGVVFTARFIPVLRQVISIPAGMARMNVFVFTIYTLVATVVWAVMFVYLGKAAGENWENIHETAGPYLQPIIWAAVVLTVAYVAYKIIAAKRRKKSASPAQGYVGEKNAARQLEQLGSAYTVLNGRQLKARTGAQEIDHLIVGPNGLFHVETKNWDGRIRFTDNGVERDGHHEDPTALLYRHEYALKELLRGNKISADVVGILCFSGTNCKIEGSSPAFIAVKLEKLVAAIKDYAPKTKLSESEIRAIATLLQEHSTPNQSA